MIFQKKKSTKESWRDRKLAMPLVLEDGHMPGFASKFLWTCCFLLVAGIIWASLVQIKEQAPAVGELKPTGSVQVVQHLEGGKVFEILKPEGSEVEAGDPILALEPLQTKADRDQLRIRVANLTLRKERLEAMLGDREPDFGDVGKEFPALAGQQAQIFNSSKLELQTRKEGLEQAITKSKAEIESLQAQVESIGLQLDIQKERLLIFEGLTTQGLVSRNTFLESSQRYEQTRFEQVSKQGQLDVTRGTLAEAEIALREMLDTNRRELSSERADVISELSEVKQQLAKQEDRLSKTIVTAPVSGVIQEIVPKAPGEVVAPGGDVARIVPEGERIIAEVKINPRDIAHVREGADVKVSVTAFDTARSADLDGKIERISTSTFLDEEGEPYYKAQVGLLTDSVLIGGQRFGVQPGMQVQAKIITGAKSVMKYLLKPVTSVVDNALSER